MTGKPAFVTARQRIVVLDSPCREFHVIGMRIYGRQLFEAFRVAGEGKLYSVATTDLAELYAVLRAECSESATG